MEKKIQCFQRPTLLSMIVPTPSCVHHQSRQENLDWVRCQGMPPSLVAFLDSHLWVLLFLYLLIKGSIIGLWLKYLSQTLESVMMTEPQLQHCWVDICSSWWNNSSYIGVSCPKMITLSPRILCSDILMTSF